MATDGIFVNVTAEGGKNPVSKYQISLSVDKKRADRGWDGRTRLARSSFQAQTGRGQKTGFLLSDLGNHTRLIHTLLW